MVMRAQAAGTTQARVAVVVAIVVVAAAAALVRAEEATRRVSMEQAQAMAHKRPAPRLVVRVDDVILTELNALVATADDRARLKAGLDRMAEEGAATQALLRREGLPVELQAVPLVESGYRNLPQAAPADAGTSAPRGAGLWQFVPETARRFGLEVGPERDDRMDVARETAAAAAYLDALHARFGDWSLALAAYNQGEGTVERAITSGGTRDAAALARSGHLNRYHATVMAAVLLMENPQLLD
jgi:hypothetical protein